MISGGIWPPLLIFQRFPRNPAAFVALRKGRLCCETGAVRLQPKTPGLGERAAIGGASI
jgi:hypothetical protein